MEKWQKSLPDAGNKKADRGSAACTKSYTWKKYIAIRAIFVL